MITALYKKDEKCLASNYKPICLTSIACKIMESIINDDLTSCVRNTHSSRVCNMDLYLEDLVTQTY